MIFSEQHGQQQTRLRNKERSLWLTNPLATHLYLPTTKAYLRARTRTGYLVRITQLIDKMHTHVSLVE